MGFATLIIIDPANLVMTWRAPDFLAEDEEALGLDAWPI